MFSDFQVTNFKCFEDFRLEKVGRINLLVGKNGVGKSSLLEALRVYAAKASPAVLREILDARNETWPVKDDARAVEAIFRYKKDGPQAILLGPRDDLLELTSIVEFPQHGVLQGHPALQVRSRSDRQIWQLDHGFSRLILASRPAWKAAEPAEPAVEYVPAGGTPPSKEAILWDAVALTAREDQVVNAMRIIIPEVDRITLVGSPEDSGRQPFVKLTSEEKPVPLRRLGDGAVRIFSLALALVNAQDGLLLIDEFENGIHYSVQEQLWDFMFYAAKNLNVQAFATTHSFDCMTAFEKAARRCESEEGVVTRLERKRSKIIPVQFDEADMEFVTREHIEIR